MSGAFTNLKLKVSPVICWTHYFKMHVSGEAGWRRVSLFVYRCVSHSPGEFSEAHCASAPSPLLSSPVFLLTEL